MRLKVTHSGLCLDLASQSNANNVRLVQRTCSSSQSQQWRREDISGDYYRLRNRYSNLCVDVAAASSTDGAALVQYSCHTNNNQQWINR